MDAVEVPASARGVAEAADRIEEIDWPAMDSEAMVGSAAASAARRPELEERVADVVARMRTWAAAVRASASAIESAESRHARGLGGGR